MGRRTTDGEDFPCERPTGAGGGVAEESDGTSGKEAVRRSEGERSNPVAEGGGGEAPRGRRAVSLLDGPPPTPSSPNAAAVVGAVVVVEGEGLLAAFVLPDPPAA